MKQWCECVIVHIAHMNVSLYIWSHGVTHTSAERLHMVRHAWMSRATHGWVMVHEWVIDTHEWVMSHIQVLYTWMSVMWFHTYRCWARWYSIFAHEWVRPHINESCHTWMSHATNQWVTHVSTHEGFVAHVNVSLAHMNELRHTYRCSVLTATSHMNESRHTWMSHISTKPCHTYRCWASS